MFKLSHVPVRLAAGAFILNSGLSKRNLSEEEAAHYQEQGALSVPQVSKLDPKTFGTILSSAEISLGAALLNPLVPSWLAGLGLAGFSGSLFRMYLKAEGTTQPDGIRPTGQGIALAKDIWMVGIAGTLILDDLMTRGTRKAKRRAKKAARRAGSSA